MWYWGLVSLGFGGLFWFGFGLFGLVFLGVGCLFGLVFCFVLIHKCMLI